MGSTVYALNKEKNSNKQGTIKSFITFMFILFLYGDTYNIYSKKIS